MKQQALVFEGGGVLGCALIYAVKHCTDKGMFILPGDCVDESNQQIVHKFAGTSIGAAVAGLMACNASIDFLKTFVDNWNLSGIMDSFTQEAWNQITCSHSSLTEKICGITQLPFAIPHDLLRIYNKGGVWKGQRLREMYADAIQVLTGNRYITLSQIYEKYHNELIVSLYNVNRKCTERFSFRNHPDCPLELVTRGSMGAPFLFEFTTIEGEIYWDGGIQDNFPIDAFDAFDELGNRVQANMGTIGFKLLTDSEFVSENNTLDPKERPPFVKIDNVLDPMVDVFSSLMSKIQRAHQEQVDFDRTIRINIHDLKPFDFDLTVQKKQAMDQYAKESVDHFNEKRILLL